MKARLDLIRIFISSISVFVGVIFIISGISKIPSLEQFGWTIVETTFLNWTIAEWVARILIGLELFLGLLFIFHVKVKAIAMPVALSLLGIFSLYLVLVIHQYGAKGNCGCFGELIPMTPLQSLIKNIILIGLISLISIKPYEFKIRWLNLLIAGIFLISLLIPFFINPPESIYIYNKDQSISKPIPLSILYQSEKNKPPSIELRKGKHIISFMSLTCEFCRKAAKRMRIMKEKYPQLPIHLILNGDESNLNAFFKDTRATNLSHSLFLGVNQFVLLNDGNSLPSIKWVEDTTVVRESSYLTLDEKEILEWLNKK